MKVSGKNIEADVENALKARLQRVPFLEIESIEREPLVGDTRVDLVATVRMGSSASVWHWKSKIAASRALPHRRLSTGPPSGAGTRAIRCLCRPLYLPTDRRDLHPGKARLSRSCRQLPMTFGQVYIEQTGMPNPFAEKRDLRSLYSPKAARVLRVLLTDPRKAWRVQPLAKEAAVSLDRSPMSSASWRTASGSKDPRQGSCSRNRQPARRMGGEHQHQKHENGELLHPEKPRGDRGGIGPGLPSRQGFPMP